MNYINTTYITILTGLREERRQPPRGCARAAAEVHLRRCFCSLPQAQELGRVFITSVRRAGALQHSTLDDEGA